MSDLDPEIWNNSTLGAASGNLTLSEIEAQMFENRAARIEGREARIVKPLNRHPAESIDDLKIRFVENSNSDGAESSREGLSSEGEAEAITPAQEPQESAWSPSQRLSGKVGESADD